MKINIFLSIVVYLATASLLMAGDLDMFPKDSARTPFAPRSEVIPQGKTEISLKAKRTKIQEVLKKGSEQKIKIDQGTQVASSSEDVLAKYGDPRQAFPVQAKSDAPVPYQAMIESLRVGNQKLAYQYAVQYERYMEDLMKINRQAVGMQGVAKTKLGTLPESSWVASEEFDSYREIANQVDIRTEEQKLAVKQPVQGTLSDNAQAMLAKAVKSENDLFKGSIEEKQDIAKIERMRARDELTENVPEIPKGAVNLYFFFKAEDQKSINSGKELQKFYANLKDKQVNVLGFNANLDSQAELGLFKRATGAKYPLANGQAFAQEVGVSTLPSLLVVDPVNFSFYAVTSELSQAYLEELVLIVRGN